MFVETTDPTYRASLLNSIVAPRPIGWISTLDPGGTANLAPFSYFNAISSSPPMVMFACNEPADRHEKDTLTNLRRTGEFVANLSTYALREQMNATSAAAPHGVDEFDLAGLAKAPSRLVKPPRVAATPVAMEGRVLRIVDFPPEAPTDRRCSVVFGRIVALHIDDAFLDDKGRFDTLKAHPIGRLGGFGYAAVNETFDMVRPGKD